MNFNPFARNNLPGLHVALGFLFFVLAGAAKDNLPTAIGSLPAIQLPCAFFSAVLIPFGSLLALLELSQGKDSRRNLIFYHLLGLIFAFAMLSFYFYAFWGMNRLLDLPSLLPNVLPKLTENARSLPDAQKRIEQAQWAYKMYGVIIAYQLDNQSVAYYVPTEEDKSFWREEQRISAKSKAITSFSKKVADEFPYLFGLYSATFTATYLVGGIWLIFRIPASPART